MNLSKSDRARLGAARRVIAALAVALSLLPTMAWPRTGEPVWRGTVTHVVDGDTVLVRPSGGGRPVSIRMHGIDAPEICQRGGMASRDALQRRVRGREVVVIGVHHDSYGRLLAKLTRDGEDINGWMVGQGHAWSYRSQRSAGSYAAQQARAVAMRRGLFAPDAGAAPQYPGAFRKSHGSCHPPRVRP